MSVLRAGAGPAGSAGRRGLQPSTHAMLAVLTGCLVGAFVWWRVAAQRRQVESYWTHPLAASAQLYRVRADDWLAAKRRTAEVLGQLAARGLGPGSAFEIAAGDALADGDVRFISIRDGEALLRCDSIPLAKHCAPGSNAFQIPSPRHPQARRVRPIGNGVFLVPAVGALPVHGNSSGGVVTLWIDPELALIPRLLRTRGSIAGATTYFVSRSGDSATVLASAPGGALLPRRRFAIPELPPLIARPAADSELIIGAGPDGQRGLAGHAYIPRLRWQVYRTLPEERAYAPFRRQTATASVLAFILGSFVIGVLVWTVRGQREQEVRAELLQARVDSLQAQLRPHFLFNALNTIATLVHEDADRADTMLLRLADLLRLSLEHSDEAELPLRNELEILDAYMAVERVRFGAALQVSKDVAPEALDVMVPRWILQPLAENAIKHGAAYTRGAVRIDIGARVEHGMLEVVLADDGPHPPGPTIREGVGLRNTRTRLATLYGREASLALRRRPGGGTEAVVRIPVAPDAAIKLLTERTGEMTIPPAGVACDRLGPCAGTVPPMRA